MAQMVDEAGNIWEVDAQGNPTAFVGRAGSAGEAASGGSLFTDPFAASEEQRRQQDQAFEAERLRIAQQNADLARQSAAAEQDKAARDRAEWDATHNPDGTPKAVAKPVSAQANADRIAQTRTVLQNIKRLRELSQQSLAVGDTSEWTKGIPWVGQNRRDVEGALQMIEGDLIQQQIAKLSEANAGKGVASLANSEPEARRMAASIANLDPNQSLPEFTTGLDRAEAFYNRQLEALGAPVSESSATTAPPPRLAGADATEQGRPIPPAMQAEHQDYMRRNAGTLDPQDYARFRAELDAKYRFGARDPSDYLDYAEAVRDSGIDASGGQIPPATAPLEGQAWLDNYIANSPVGAALIGAGDTASLGFLDNLFSDPEMARAGMSAISEENPNAYLAGQILGGVSTGLGLENVAGRAGLSGLRATRAGEAAFGAGYGAGSTDNPDESRIAGALIGAGSGVAGGALGRGAARTVGRGISGLNDEATRLLGNAGVRMTPGQLLGGGLKRAEDAMTSWPVVGGMIQGVRREGVEDFNRAAMAEAVAPIGAAAPREIGEAGVLANQGAISQAYRDALEGTQVIPDAQFEDDLAAAVLGLGNIPRVGDEVVDSVGDIVNLSYFDPVTDALPGTNMQPMLQELRGLRSGYASDPLGNRVGQGIRDVEGAVTGMFERQAPEVMPAFNAANTAYRNQSVIDDAVLKGRNTGGVFTPAQLGIASVSNAGRFGGKRQAAAGNRPFFDLQRAGQDVLPSQIPDSGTAGRMLLPAVIAGGVGGGGGYAAQEGGAAERAGGALGTAAIAAALASAPYSAPARAALQRALLAERPELMMRFGNTLLDQDRIAGLLAAPAAVGMVSQ